MDKDMNDKSWQIGKLVCEQICVQKLREDNQKGKERGK